jgi:ABC-type antimicrobial peptide transport system permease subunit
MMAAAGVAIGAVAAWQLTRLLGYLLYKVSPRDPMSFGFAFAVIGMASLVACLLPALRATRTDPVLALRS